MDNTTTHNDTDKRRDKDVTPTQQHSNTATQQHITSSNTTQYMAAQHQQHSTCSETTSHGAWVATSVQVCGSIYTLTHTSITHATTIQTHPPTPHTHTLCMPLTRRPWPCFCSASPSPVLSLVPSSPASVPPLAGQSMSALRCTRAHGMDVIECAHAGCVLVVMHGHTWTCGAYICHADSHQHHDRHRDGFKT